MKCLASHAHVRVTSSCVANIKWLGGLSEWPTLAPSPHPRLGPSVNAYCLVHVTSLHLSKILFVLASNFRLYWLWRNKELVLDIVRGKFAKQLLSVFFLPNEVISYVYKVGASVLSLCTCNIMRWFSLESPVVERKYEKQSFTSGIGRWHDVSVSLVHGFAYNKVFPTSTPRTRS